MLENLRPRRSVPFGLRVAHDRATFVVTAKADDGRREAALAKPQYCEIEMAFAQKDLFLHFHGISVVPCDIHRQIFCDGGFEVEMHRFSTQNLA